MTMQPFPCDSCNAPNTPLSIMFRCGTCYYQNGKPPTKYVPIDIKDVEQLLKDKNK